MSSLTLVKRDMILFQLGPLLVDMFTFVAFPGGTKTNVKEGTEGVAVV